MQSELLNALEARGCAIAATLAETYMAREDFYVRILKRLPESTALARIRESVAAGDASVCFEAAHELKGLYATLGLTPAYATCSALVEKVRPLAGLDGVDELLARLEGLHADFVALISRA